MGAKSNNKHVESKMEPVAEQSSTGPVSSFKNVKFSRVHLAAFIVLFGCVGLFLLRAFAVAPLVATLEGENMLMPTTSLVGSRAYPSTLGTTTTQAVKEAEAMQYSPSSSGIEVDSSASGGKRLVQFTNGTVSYNYSFSGTVTAVSITAKSTVCKGVYSNMVVKVDGSTIISRTVVSTTWKDITKAINLAGGSHSLSITFTNDYYNTGLFRACDRNLYIDKVALTKTDSTTTPTPLPAPTPTPVPAPTPMPTPTPVSPVPATVPAFGVVETDSAASNGKYLLLYANGTATGQFSTTSAATSMTIIARGDSCNGSWPNMTVKVDGNQVLSQPVNDGGWQNYSVAVSLAGGSHSLSIGFDNDLYVAGSCDSNLYIDVVNFYGQSTTPTPTPVPTVSLSASPSSVSAGTPATLTWNSANATSCVASGAWSGSQQVSGSLSTGALNQNSTYTLSCSGTGGTATASASVTVIAASSSGTVRNASPGNVLSVIAQASAGETVLLQDGNYSKLVLGRSFTGGILTVKCSAGAVIAGADTNGHSGYTFDSCKVAIPVNTTDISVRAVQNRGPSQNIIWKNCTISGGFTAWDVYGASGSWAKNISIIDSDIYGAGGDLIHTNGVDGLLIEHNNIHDPIHDFSLGAAAEHHDGWQPESTTNAKFLRNHIYWTSGAGAFSGYNSSYLGQGIMVSGGAGAVSNVLIANNLIDHFNGREINMNGVSNIKIINNTFQSSGDGISITVGTGVSGLEIWNNIVQSVYLEGSNPAHFDSNWITGGNGGYMGNATGTTYWSGDPQFANTSTYALKVGGNAYIKGSSRSGTPTVDIDNTSRPTPPALGARL